LHIFELKDDAVLKVGTGNRDKCFALNYFKKKITNPKIILLLKAISFLDVKNKFKISTTNINLENFELCV
jgi:hypothetical protein